MGPLDGRVVGITADRRWEEQADLLTRRGATVVHGATIETIHLASSDILRAVTEDLIAEPPDYVVATTGMGMREWLDAATEWRRRDDLINVLNAARIVARGPKAAAALTNNELTVWQRSPTEQMAGIREILLNEQLDGRRVAIQEFGVDSPELVDALHAANATVVSVPVYRWRLPSNTEPARTLMEATRTGQLDAVTFTSAPAVHNLFIIAGAMRDEMRTAFNSTVTAACVGPVCAGGAHEEGIEHPLTPAVGRLGLLVRALSDHLSGESATS